MARAGLGCVVLVWVTLTTASVSRAFPIAYGVQWNFEATAHVTGDLGACCSPLVAAGDHVTGSLAITNGPVPFPGAIVSFVGASVSLPGGGSFGIGASSSTGAITKQDGAHGTPDRLVLQMIGPD